MTKGTRKKILVRHPTFDSIRCLITRRNASIAWWFKIICGLGIIIQHLRKRKNGTWPINSRFGEFFFILVPFIESGPVNNICEIRLITVSTYCMLSLFFYGPIDSCLRETRIISSFFFKYLQFFFPITAIEVILLAVFSIFAKNSVSCNEIVKSLAQKVRQKGDISERGSYSACDSAAGSLCDQ